MNFVDSIQTCLVKKYMDFSGRASRSEFWWFYLFCIILLVLSCFIGKIVYYILALALFLPSLGVSVRRLHDTNMSGWWILLSLIPVVGALVLLYFYVIEGTKGPNNYGNPVV
ncbi:Inner membrane protein YhaI [Aquicella siphonis]|uniref:Inner membrane protein YhaI n=1 Tax=Aquicella siphonis TaxID=254247 RepID=A0A5E4PFI6_9COXI|nr:DUF805 domain-containing protein [Aquicella siphonis]VVC75749.1 Inner membrane protein YhaI [Aquicella siphonis]